ncbi:NAD-dependent epimerase/dehydratase family protein [Fontimonas thermophila]|uniref:NAD-dependent epimerase/dehydratase family protein n=1 Tax=Fontimonas thermophila TaxID=1076937 RepID=UPI0013565BD0|nr:NAD-dependent epimerase/dehydratase family protein [Fontimonas thermophila]
MAKTAFVTGATGFVGLNLIEALHEQGWHVIALHRVDSDISVLHRFRNVERVVGDITDMRSLKDLIPRHVDCVFHTAGNTSLWVRAQVEQMKVNVRGTRNVARAALEARAKRFVHTSSIVAYGLHGGTITEETPTRGSAVPINYIRSKALSEREVRRAISAGLKAVILNPSNIIGRYDTSSWARMFRLVQQGRLPAVPPGGGSFCHARAVALAQIAAAERGQVGHNYLLGGAQASYVGLARAIAEALGLRRRIIAMHPGILSAYARIEEWIAPLFGREPDVTRDAVALLSQNLYCSSRKAERELGYKSCTLDEMVRDCRDWLRSAGLL